MVPGTTVFFRKPGSLPRRSPAGRSFSRRQMADGRWQMADGRWQMAIGSGSVLTRHSRLTKSQLTGVRETQKGCPGAGQIVVSVWIASLELAVGHLPII